MATTPVLRAQFPSGPLLDGTELTPVWRAYFAQLYVRTGGAAGASSDTTQLQADLDAEEAARLAADVALTNAVEAERTAREAADAAEAAARAAADAAERSARISADAQLLPLVGGVMRGMITLPAITPTAPLHAVSKSYVDGAVGGMAYAPIDSPPFTGNPTAPTPAPGDADTSIATTAFVAAAVAPALNNVGRNIIHNAMFNVAQRGAGPWTTSVYTADRWLAGTVLDTISVSIAAFGDGARAQIGDEAARSFISNTFTGNAGASAQNYIEQRIEGMTRLSGKTVTVSFWVTSSNAALKIAANIYQNPGAGGSPSAGAWALATGASLPTTLSWARVSTTIAIPSSAGMTLGTNGDNCTILRLHYSSGATNNAVAGNIGVQSGTINVWGVQLEIGSVATPLEKPDPQLDLANCQRFYQAHPLMYISGYAPTGNVLMATIAYPVTMRTTPTVVITPGVSANTGAMSSYAVSATEIVVTASITATGWGYSGTSLTLSADL